jgi:F-type H+-transporting ATPase subunit b
LIAQIHQFMISGFLSFAQAGEAGGGVSFWNNPAIWRPLNLLIFIAILVYILRNKIGIGQVLDKRAVSIRNELDQARREKEEAERRLEQVLSRLNKLDDEIAAIQSEAARDAERELERIAAAAEADAEKIRQTAQREIEGAVRAAKAELRAFVAEQSVDLAESIIRKEIRPEDSTRLVTKYIDELGEVRK